MPNVGLIGAMDRMVREKDESTRSERASERGLTKADILESFRGLSLEDLQDLPPEQRDTILKTQFMNAPFLRLTRGMTPAKLASNIARVAVGTSKASSVTNKEFDAFKTIAEQAAKKAAAEQAAQNAALKDVAAHVVNRVGRAAITRSTNDKRFDRNSEGLLERKFSDVVADQVIPGITSNEGLLQRKLTQAKEGLGIK